MAQCLLYHGWLVLLKTGACCGLPIFFEVTTNWRAGCQKLACPVRREGRPESSSLPLSRRHAIRAPNCGLSRSSKLNSKNNDSTKVWENLTEANDGDLHCQPLDWIRSPPLQRRVYKSMQSKGLYDSCLTSLIKSEFSNA